MIGFSEQYVESDQLEIALHDAVHTCVSHTRPAPAPHRGFESRHHQITHDAPSLSIQHLQVGHQQIAFPTKLQYVMTHLSGGERFEVLAAFVRIIQLTQRPVRGYVFVAVALNLASAELRGVQEPERRFVFSLQAVRHVAYAVEDEPATVQIRRLPSGSRSSPSFVPEESKAPAHGSAGRAGLRRARYQARPIVRPRPRPRRRHGGCV